MKLKILQWLTGKFGPIITPMISAAIGASVAALYAWLGTTAHNWPMLESFFSDIWFRLDSNTQAALQPTAIGAVVGMAVYGLIQEWLTGFFVKDVKAQQQQINRVLPPIAHIKVDGIPLDETISARKEIHDAALVEMRRQKTK